MILTTIVTEEFRHVIIKQQLKRTLGKQDKMWEKVW